MTSWTPPSSHGLTYRSMMAHGGSSHSRGELIHLSAWKGNSANFAFWGFSEVRLTRVLGSPAQPRSKTYELYEPGLRSLMHSRQAPLVSSSHSEAPSDLSFSPTPTCALLATSWGRKPCPLACSPTVCSGAPRW